METKVVKNKCPDIAKKLLEFYPDGLVMGRCKAIVGNFGLTVQWCNPDGTKGQNRYKEGDELYITEVRGDSFILSEPLHQTILHKDHFKGFRKVM